MIMPLFYSLVVFPFAIIHQSTLFGYIFYFNLFLKLYVTLNKGRRHFCDSCLGLSIVAFLINLIFVILRISDVNDKFTEPFASSVETLNRNILYFGVLSDVAICGYRNTNPCSHLIYLALLGSGLYYEMNYQTKGF